jgi:hypothetical protein
MLVLGQFDRGVGERAAAVIGRPDVGGHFLDPRPQLPARIAREFGRSPAPAGLGFSRKPAEVFRYKLVLRLKMPVERHLVRAGRLGDRFDPHSPDSMAIKEIGRGRQNALARRDSIILFMH